MLLVPDGPNGESGVATLHLVADVTREAAGPGSPPPSFAEGTFVIAASRPLWTDEHHDSVAKVTLISTTALDMVAVELSCGDRPPQAFVGLRLSAVTSLLEPGSGGTNASITVFLPLEPSESIESAVITLDSIPSALGNSPEPPEYGGFDCLSPEWVGLQGVQCCSLWDNYNDSLSSCWSTFLAELGGCFGPPLVDALTTTALCIGALLIVTGALPHLVLAACFGVGFIVLGSQVVSCVWSAWWRYDACKTNARATYRRDLMQSGCLNNAPAEFLP